MRWILFYFVVIFGIIILQLLIKTFIWLEEILYRNWIMNQISQYFGKNPKKRDLSAGSKIGDGDTKKPWEGSSYTEEADVFEEAVESADCRKVLFNCLKNLELKMNDLYMLANINKEVNTLKERNSLLI